MRRPELTHRGGSQGRQLNNNVTDVYALAIASPTDPARLETLPPTTPAGPSRHIAVGGRYLLERPIGEGSTGRVWQAIRRPDGAAVAVKVLRP